MEEDNTDVLMQSILQELQTLNQNFSDYRVYIEDRNTLADEKAVQKEQALAEKEAEQAEKLKQEEQEQQEQVSAQATETDSYIEKLTLISNTLTDFETKTTTHSENIEYNTSYIVTTQCIVVGLIALTAGFFFARVVFRKL